MATEERRVHVYASGRGFDVVPVCLQNNGTWVECQPVQRISLVRGRALPRLLGRAIARAADCPCAQLQPLSEKIAHYLVAARLTWHTGVLRLFFPPESEAFYECTINTSHDLVARHIMRQLRIALA